MSGRDGRARGFYKDSENGVLLGVCAGVARYFGFSRNGVRIVTVIALLFMFWPVLLAYVAAGFLLRDKPLCYCGRDDERSFWRHDNQRI